MQSSWAFRGTLTYFDPVRITGKLKGPVGVAVVLFLLITGLSAGSRPSKTPLKEVEVPPLQLLGGRSLSYERSFSTDRDVIIKKGFWTKVLDLVAGPPDLHFLVRPYSIATDSRGRIIVTDPGAVGVHIFDFAQQKYKFLQREGKEHFESPQCVAVDSHDNIYVTDSEAGKVFVFEPNGKLRHVLGSLKGGEGFFKRPTGIAVDSAAQRIYVSDTLRDKIFVLDMQGNVLQTIGKRGAGNGEFAYPTELRLYGDDLVVVDAMNFRVQVLDRSGQFRYAIGHVGETTGTLFRPKGIGRDSEGNLYIVDAAFETVQVFDRDGHILYYFGETGQGPAEFQLPSGLYIDGNDRIYVADSFNHRVQVFHYSGLKKQPPSGAGGPQ
jgi:DNA-binding beta-propeller fold protein YncE